MPQVHILLVIWFLSGGPTFFNDFNANWNCNTAVPFDVSFVVTFSLSVLSATFGVSKFIKLGPARMINNEKCFKGFCSITYVLLFLNICTTLVGRGFVIGNYVWQLHFYDFGTNNIFFVILCFTPQLLHVSSCALACKVHFHMSFNFLAGISHSLFCLWHQEGNKKGRCTPRPCTDTCLQFLDLWSSEIGQLLRLQEFRDKNLPQL